MLEYGDFDDAVDVIDIWLRTNPETAPWEREETILPLEYSFSEGMNASR